jgi:hypothetical protein
MPHYSDVQTVLHFAADHILCNEDLEYLDCLADPLVAVQLERHGNDDDPINEQLWAWGFDAGCTDHDFNDCQSVGLQVKHISTHATVCHAQSPPANNPNSRKLPKPL